MMKKNQSIMKLKFLINLKKKMKYLDQISKILIFKNKCDKNNAFLTKKLTKKKL